MKPLQCRRLQLVARMAMVAVMRLGLRQPVARVGLELGMKSHRCLPQPVVRMAVVALLRLGLLQRGARVRLEAGLKSLHCHLMHLMHLMQLGLLLQVAQAAL